MKKLLEQCSKFGYDIRNQGQWNQQGNKGKENDKEIETTVPKQKKEENKKRQPNKKVSSSRGRWVTPKAYN